MDIGDASQLSLFPIEGQNQGFEGDISPNSPMKATFDAFDSWMQEEPREFTENTRKAFASDLRLLEGYLRIGQSVGDIGTKDLNDFLNWLLNERGVPCSQKSYARRVTTLKVYFKWLFEDKKAILSDPSLEVIQISVSSPLPDLPSDMDMERALATAEKLSKGHGEDKTDSRPLLLLSLLLDTGLKKSEVMATVLNHVNRQNPDAPYLFVRYKNPTKRYKERKMPLDPEWIALLDEYMEEYAPSDSLFTCTARNLEYILTDIGEQVGLPTGAISFENLRWMYALNKYQSDAEPITMMNQLGIKEVTWRQTKSKLDRLIARRTVDDLQQ